MFVRNWMHPQELSISSDALATEAVTLISQNNLKMLPVVDNGRLRGVVHRRDLSEAATCVSESGNTCEMNYFCNKLKVKDVMVRMPVTVSVDDSVEDVLMKGRGTNNEHFSCNGWGQSGGSAFRPRDFCNAFQTLGGRARMHSNYAC